MDNKALFVGRSSAFIKRNVMAGDNDEPATT
jgi:hypothetical protein